MARVKRNETDNVKDISTYTDLGEMYWREALDKAYSPGIDTVAVCPEMFHLKGVKRLIPRHKTRDKVMVIYDREYIFYRMYVLFGKKLEIVKNGVFDEDKYVVVFDGLREYSAKEFQREHRNKILSQAKLLDEQFPGKGISHWISILSNDDKKETKKDDETTTSNNETEVHTNDTIQTTVDVTDVTTIETDWEVSDDIKERDFLVTENEALEDEATDVEVVIATVKDIENIDTSVAKKRGRPKKECNDE